EEMACDGPLAAVDPSQVAYALYTSGSTGRPKGEMNTHRAVVNPLYSGQRTFALGAGERVVQQTPISFDVSVWEVFWTLATGPRLVLARPGGHRDPAYLVELIERERVTLAQFVPSMLEAFLAGRDVERCASLRRLIVGGEELTRELERRFSARLGVPLYNLY